MDNSTDTLPDGVILCGTTAAGLDSGGANATREVAPVPLRTHARSSNVSNIVGDVVGGGRIE